jgi:anti-anti-sigma factor
VRRRRIVVRLTAQQIDSVLVLAVDGELSRPVAPAFLRMARQLARPLTRPLMVVDLAHVPRVDASGFGALVSLLRDVDRRGGALCLAGVRPEVRLLLEIMQLHLLFEVCSTVDEAVGGVGRSAPEPARATRQWGRYRADARLLRRAS